MYFHFIFFSIFESIYKDYERRVKQLLPENKFTLMIVVLKKFYEFLKLTANVR